MTLLSDTKGLLTWNGIKKTGFTYSWTRTVPSLKEETELLYQTLSGDYCREAGGNYRSVMPLDVLGRTRVTMAVSTSVILEQLACDSRCSLQLVSLPEKAGQTFLKIQWFKGERRTFGGAGSTLKQIRDWDSRLQLFDSNEECLVRASHQLALITSLPFVHTARRSYRLTAPVKLSESWITLKRLSQIDLYFMNSIQSELNLSS